MRTSLLLMMPLMLQVHIWFLANRLRQVVNNIDHRVSPTPVPASRAE
jgi:hypothetical protein